MLSLKRKLDDLGGLEKLKARKKISFGLASASVTQIS